MHHDPESVPAISVIMPTFNQSTFIRRAIQSVLDQDFQNWELIIIDDGCTDGTFAYLEDFLCDTRITYLKHLRNAGLGAALNNGLGHARADIICYLPSDDFYFKEHLSAHIDIHEADSRTLLVLSGCISGVNDSFGQNNIKKVNDAGIFEEHGLQLVQTSHRRSKQRWAERTDFVTDDLSKMFWDNLCAMESGEIFKIKKVTCSWTVHLNQRHKIINPRFGGQISRYKQYYNVECPIVFTPSQATKIDEIALYSPLKPKVRLTKKPLKILIVGELSYNPERILAFEEDGHQLFGLWSPDTAIWTNTGPLPFGNIFNIPYDRNWREKVLAIKPDIIYALLNHHAIPIAHEVLYSKLSIPMVWHFKEGPFVAMQKGYFEKLIDLYRMSDGKIFLNDETLSWFSQFVKFSDSDRILLMDGDPVRAGYLTGEFNEKISYSSGVVHTVNCGRLIGFDVEKVAELARYNIHLHCYGAHDTKFNEAAKAVAPMHFHQHAPCPPAMWRSELSKYDAGWMHFLSSSNYGDINRFSWDDMNMPCRMNTYAVAGLPVIHPLNNDHIVAARNHLGQLGVGILFSDMRQLAEQLHDHQLMSLHRTNMLEQMHTFSFEYHLPRLLNFFHKVIDSSHEAQR